MNSFFHNNIDAYNLLLQFVNIGFTSVLSSFASKMSSFLGFALTVVAISQIIALILTIIGMGKKYFAD